MRLPKLQALLVACALCLLACSDREESAELLAMLEEGGPEDRLEALQHLARSPRSLELPRLRLLLDDPSPAVRIQALAIAAKRSEPPIVDWVGSLVEDPDPEVRRAALDALRRFDAEAREPHLVAAYPLQDLAGRRAILDELSGRDEKLLRLIGAEAQRIWERNLEALRAGGVAELEGALELLGRSGRPEAMELLARLVESGSTRVAVAAARGLALGGGGEVAREALEALATSEIPERRHAAREALSRLGFAPSDPEDEGEESEASPREPTAGVRARALLDPRAAGRVTPDGILALRDVDASAAAAAARLHLAHDRPEIRAAAAEVLGRRCDWEAMPILRALAAKDYFVEVRQAAESAVEAVRACPR